MSLDLWSRAKPVYERLQSVPPVDQPAVLAEMCGGDSALRDEVERLLALDAESGGFFASLRDDLYEPGASCGALPERIGPWRVVREIGRGGMGRVVLAERDDESFEQKVAIKLVESAAPGLVRRFHRERRILASLDHPGIARLLDGGTLPDGRPYLVMDYVEGQPLTTYADAHRLSVEDRLRLFVQVCEVAAYAHRSLVVHLDLKPSNILVAQDAAGRPTVKLLDFGIARLVDTDELVTQTRQLAYSPVYAAPEQIRGEPPTTATDVYALGVVLYELLTGQRPVSHTGRGRGEVEALVLHEDPPLPSAVAATQDGRSPTSARLRRRLRGDLDRIVVKALRKEPDRRYGSAETLGQEIIRHLEGLPVEARRPTVGYRVHRFVRRHRIGVAMTAVMCGVLAAGGALYTHRVQQERQLAQAGAARAERVGDFLAEMLSRVDDPSVDATTLLPVIDPSVERAETELAEDPQAQAAVFHALGQLYRRLGQSGRADTLLRRALALRLTIHTDPHEDVAETLYALGQLNSDRGQPDSAGIYFRRSARIRQFIHSGDHPDLAWSLLQWARMQPKGEAGKRERYEESLAMLRRLHGARSPEVAEAIHEYYALGHAEGTEADYEAAFQTAIAIYREHGMMRDPRALSAMYNLGLHYEREGQPERAFPLFEEAIRRGRQVYPPGHAHLRTMLINYGASLHEQGQLEEADRVLGEIAETLRMVMPEGSRAIGHSHYWYGRNLSAMGRYAEAETVLRRAVSNYEARAPDSPRTHRIRIELAWALAQQGKASEAIALLEEGAEALRGTSNEALALERLLVVYEKAGRAAQAESIRARLDELTP